MAPGRNPGALRILSSRVEALLLSFLSSRRLPGVRGPLSGRQGTWGLHHLVRIRAPSDDRALLARPQAREIPLEVSEWPKIGAGWISKRTAGRSVGILAATERA